jgi:hypothetical protein
MYFTRKTGAVLGTTVLLAAAGALAASPASAQPASQLWQIVKSGVPGPIINLSSRQCLTQDTPAGIGIPVATLQDCTGADDQFWEVTPGLDLIINRSTGQCLTEDTPAGIGIPVATLQDCTGADDQRWLNEVGKPGPIRNALSKLDLAQGTAAGIGLPVATLQPAA